MTTLTPEQRQEIQTAGEEPVRLADPATQTEYVILKADVYERIRALADVHLSQAGIDLPRTIRFSPRYPAQERPGRPRSRYRECLTSSRERYDHCHRALGPNRQRALQSSCAALPRSLYCIPPIRAPSGSA